MLFYNNVKLIMFRKRYMPVGYNIKLFVVYNEIMNKASKNNSPFWQYFSLNNL